MARHIDDLTPLGKEFHHASVQVFRLETVFGKEQIVAMVFGFSHLLYLPVGLLSHRLQFVKQNSSVKLHSVLWVDGFGLAFLNSPLIRTNQVAAKS